MVDCQFVAAMGLPGGGRTFITPRFARHFHHVGICEFDSDTMTRIFSTILGHFFTKVRPLTPHPSHLHMSLSVPQRPTTKGHCRVGCRRCMHTAPVEVFQVSFWYLDGKLP